jgi:hypothetical protein
MMLDQRSRVDVVPIRTGRNRYKYPLPAFVHAPTPPTSSKHAEVSVMCFLGWLCCLGWLKAEFSACLNFSSWSLWGANVDRSGIRQVTPNRK